MTRRICVVTGSRAEYGLLRPLLEGIRASDDLELDLVATGMHLSPEFGMTVGEIVRDGYPVHRVEMLLSGDTPVSIAKSMGVGMLGFADLFARLCPDLLVVLGDRYEIFVAASVATISRIPIAHLHGGETTEGAFDEALRHSITKMSHLHFVAAPAYRDRVIQMGEQPERVFLSGGLGVDAITRTPLLDRERLEAQLGFSIGERSLLVTFHPVTLEASTATVQMEELLAGLDMLRDVTLILTMPNADTDGRALIAMVEEFAASRPHAHAFSSLGQVRYLSCLQFVDGVVGNSSSGLTEAPTFGIGTVNIGERQLGRLKAGSVIDCAPERRAIAESCARLFTAEFRHRAQGARNPYGEAGASEIILGVLRDHPLDALLKKKFHDISHTAQKENAVGRS